MPKDINNKQAGEINYNHIMSQMRKKNQFKDEFFLFYPASKNISKTNIELKKADGENILN